jgi:hypothetical protein
LERIRSLERIVGYIAFRFKPKRVPYYRETYFFS